MGLIATDINETVSFSLKEDQGEDRTVFQLRALDYRERQFTRRLVYAEGDLMKVAVSKDGDGKPEVKEEKTEVGLSRRGIVDSSIWTVRLGLTGWTENFKTQAGSPVPFEKESVSIPGVGTREVLKESIVLRFFRGTWISDISAQILNLSSLDGEQEKN
jgi:hypothetical protein